jgi:hypothetical protein
MKPEDIEVGKTYLRRGKSRDREGVLREWEHRRLVERITGNGSVVFRDTWRDFSARHPTLSRSEPSPAGRTGRWRDHLGDRWHCGPPGTGRLSSLGSCP